MQMLVIFDLIFVAVCGAQWKLKVEPYSTSTLKRTASQTQSHHDARGVDISNLK